MFYKLSNTFLLEDISEILELYIDENKDVSFTDEECELISKLKSRSFSLIKSKDLILFLNKIGYDIAIDYLD